MTRSNISTAQVRDMIPELSTRDIDIVVTVGHLRYVKASHLERLYFSDLIPSGRSRRRRYVMDRLRRLKLVTPLQRRIGGVRAGSSGLVYALGPAGQRLLQIQAGEIRRTRTIIEPSVYFLDHTLAVAELFTLAHETELEVLDVQEEPMCWREISMHRRQQLILKPDLYLEVAEGEYVFPWFIEIDRGTEWTPALKRKMAVYQTAYENGLVDEADSSSFPPVLWLVPDERRRQVVARAVEESGVVDGLCHVAVDPGSADELAQLLIPVDDSDAESAAANYNGVTIHHSPASSREFLSA